MDIKKEDNTEIKTDVPSTLEPVQMAKGNVTEHEKSIIDQNENESTNINPRSFIYTVTEKSKSKSTHSVIANYISFFGLLVSGFLAVYTYLLFKETQKSTQAAIKAANEAIRATDISEKNYELAKKSQEQSDIAFQINLNRLERESDATIQFFDEPTTGITFEPGKNIRKQFYLKNLGKYTVKILSTHSELKILESQPNVKEILKSQRQAAKDIYISPESPLEFGITSTFKVSNEQYNSVVSTKKSAIYIYGFIIFQNQVTMKVKRYDYVIKNDGIITTFFEYNKTTFIKQ